MRYKFSLNLFLVVLLYAGILIAGLAGILTEAYILAGLAIIFLILIIRLIKTRRKD